jgi:hypothetical protein
LHLLYLCYHHHHRHRLLQVLAQQIVNLIQFRLCHRKRHYRLPLLLRLMQKLLFEKRIQANRLLHHHLLRDYRHLHHRPLLPKYRNLN